MDIQVIRAHTKAQLDLAFQCHGNWFVEAGCIPPDPAGLYLNAYTGRAVYFMAISDNQPVGVVHLLERAPFRTLTEFELDRAYQSTDFSEKVCIEATALCWRTNWGVSVLPHLYRALCQHGLLKDKQRMISSLDERVVTITRRMGFPMTIIGKSKYVNGSQKTPILIEREQLLAYFDQHSHNPVVRILQKPLQ